VGFEISKPHFVYAVRLVDEDTAAQDYTPSKLAYLIAPKDHFDVAFY